LYISDGLLTDVVLFQILAHFGVIKATTYWTTANVEFGLGYILLEIDLMKRAITLTVEM
jgi:hypothetical protein